MSKYTLPFERCWLVRGYSINNPKKPLFHVVANEWNGSPVHATIYPSEEAAQRLIDDMRYHKRAGFGVDCVAEPVPLEGAVHTLGIKIELKKE